MQELRLRTFQRVLMDLQQILSRCEPGPLSAANFKNLLRDSKIELESEGDGDGVADPGIHDGLGADEPIESSDRDLDVLAKWVSDLSVTRSRLARDLWSPRSLGTSGKDTTGSRTWARRSF